MDSEQMSAIAGAHSTLADKIRALAAQGVSRADIARFLGKRYQHVRNVLEGDAQSGGRPFVLGQADLSGVRERPAAYEADGDDPSVIERRGPGVYWLRVRPDGTLPIPREVAKALDASPGKRVFSELKDGQCRILSAKAAMEEVRAIARRRIPAGASVVDEFLEERKAMWGEGDD